MHFLSPEVVVTIGIGRVALWRGETVADCGEEKEGEGGGDLGQDGVREERLEEMIRLYCGNQALSAGNICHFSHHVAGVVRLVVDAACN